MLVFLQYDLYFTLYILCSMLRIVRKPHSGGCVLTAKQEWAVVEMVRARNDIRLSEIKQAIEEDNDTFANVASISLPTIGRFLRAEYVQVWHYIVLLILFDTSPPSYVYWNNTVKRINKYIF